MARLNDNLFTTLVARAVPCEIGCFLPTRLSWVRLRCTPRGLAELFYVDKKPSNVMVDSVFREAFLEWVAQFQHLDAAAKGRYLDLTGTGFQKSVWQRVLAFFYF